MLAGLRVDRDGGRGCAVELYDDAEVQIAIRRDDARAETAAERPMFSSAFKSRRSWPTTILQSN